MGRPDADLASSTRSPPVVHIEVESDQQSADDHTHQQQLHLPQNLQEIPVHSLQAVNFPPQNPQVNTRPMVQFGLGPAAATSPNYMVQPLPTQYQAPGYPQYYVQAPPHAVQYVPGNYVPQVNAQAHPGYNMAGAQVPIQLASGGTVGAMQNPPQYMSSSLWETGLFDCIDDPLNALITCCFPCLTFGQVAEILDQGNTSCATSALLYGLIACLIGCPCFMSCTYRTKLRSKYNLIETPAPDWITHFLCECCALCQEYRELQKRGLDPSIGWHSNLAKNPSLMQNQIVMVPPVHQNMRG